MDDITQKVEHTFYAHNDNAEPVQTFHQALVIMRQQMNGVDAQTLLQASEQLLALAQQQKEIS